MKQSDRKMQRRQEAAERQAAYSKLSLDEKLAKLEGFVAAKQRAKLEKEVTA